MNGADPAGRSIMSALLQHYSRTGNALMRFAAVRRTLTDDAMSVQNWKAVQRASIRRIMTERLQPKHRQCLYENMGRRLSLRYMINFIKNLILPRPRKFWGRICMKD